jgi:hypothetical protein
LLAGTQRCPRKLPVSDCRSRSKKSEASCHCQTVARTQRQKRARADGMLRRVNTRFARLLEAKATISSAHGHDSSPHRGERQRTSATPMPPVRTNKRSLPKKRAALENPSRRDASSVSTRFTAICAQDRKQEATQQESSWSVEQ